MVKEDMDTDDPRSSMPAELHHPHSKYSQWKFKLFRVRSMEKAPLPGETEPEKGALLGISSSAAPKKEPENGVTPESVMKLCLGGKSKENVESPGQRVDIKLQEMETHMNHLRCLCRLCGTMLKKVKGPAHEVHGDLDMASRGALCKMGCKLTSWPEIIHKVFKVDVTEDTESLHPLLFCHRCWMTAIRGGGVCCLSRIRVPQWKSHSSLCQLCYPRKPSYQRIGRKRRKTIPRAQSLAKRSRWDHGESVTVGDRRALRHPVLKKKVWTHREKWVRSITHCQKDHLSTDMISEKLPVDFLFSLTCVVCDHLLCDPTQLPCRHLSCRSCILKYSHVLGPQCPSCNLPFAPDDLTSPPSAFLSALQSVPLLCPIAGCGRQVRLDSFKAHCLSHELDEQDENKQPLELDNYLLANKGGRPRQHLLSLTRRAQKHRLRDLKNQVKEFAEKEEGGDLKSVCMTLFLLALRSGNEHRQADELEAIMRGKELL